MLKFLFKSNFLGFVEASVGVLLIRKGLRDTQKASHFEHFVFLLILDLRLLDEVNALTGHENIGLAVCM